jgi:hypothetical protein
MSWRPREDDLAPWTRRALEEAYQQRERPKCSRDDFRDGFLAALVFLRARSSFDPGRWDPDGEVLPW